MRSDMKKVLTERPRTGGGRYSDIRAKQNRGDVEDLPTKQGMRRPYGWDDRKEFSDLLGPLKRYLQSSIGRKWNDVWSEICQQLSNNTVDSHLKGHVTGFVDTKTVLVDGDVVVYGRFGCHAPYDLYVHPVTGLICQGERKRYKGVDPNIIFRDGISYRKDENGVLWPTNYYHNKQSTHFARMIIGFEHEAVRVKGIWYWVVFKTVSSMFDVDVVTGVSFKKDGRYRAVRVQMNRQDLKRYNLMND